MVKESVGSVLQVSKDELETDITREKKEIGLPLGYSALTSLVVSGLLIESNKIESSGKIIFIKQNHAYLDFAREE